MNASTADDNVTRAAEVIDGVLADYGLLSASGKWWAASQDVARALADAGLIAPNGLTEEQGRRLVGGIDGWDYEEFRRFVSPWQPVEEGDNDG